MSAFSKDYPISDEDVQNEINQINLATVQQLDPTIKDLIYTCKVTKLMEFLDVWHTKEKGPCFLVEKQSSGPQRLFAFVKLNQEEYQDDLIVDLTKKLDFGFNEGQHMIYWKEEYIYGLWIADNEEFNVFRSKLMEIMASVKQNA